MRTFIKFDLPENIASWSVVEAKISIKKRDYAAPTVRAHRIFRNWDPTKITWGSQPNFSYTTVSSEAVHYAGDWYRIDVKDIVTSWLSGRYENHGFALKEETEGNANKKRSIILPKRILRTSRSCALHTIMAQDRISPLQVKMSIAWAMRWSIMRLLGASTWV